MGCASGSSAAAAEAPPPPAPDPPSTLGGPALSPRDVTLEARKIKKSPSKLVGGAKTKDLLAAELADDTVSIRRPCKYGLKCYRRNDEHLARFSHPDDDDYVKGLRKHGGKGEFFTLAQCFRFVDPYQKGIIDDKDLVEELLTKHLELDISVDEVWAALDDDGNGFASFPEFVEWASGLGERWPGGPLPMGLEEDAASPSASVECTFAGCRCKRFRGKGLTKFCACGHKRALHAASDDQTTITHVPPYWSSRSGVHDTEAPKNASSYEWLPCDDDVVSQIQGIVDASVKQVWTRDRGRLPTGEQKPVPIGYEVVKVQRNENSKIWRKYWLKRALIKNAITSEGGDIPPLEEYHVKTAIDGIPFMEEERLDTSCNEWFLWHGTSLAGAYSICEFDFKQRLAGSATGTLYGPGTYFAESCTKADEYAKEAEVGEHEGLFTVLLCRVVGGRVKYTDEVEPEASELTDAVLHGHYDSVIGDREKCRNTFREFVVFGSDQAYPEFVVLYKRKA